MSSTSACSAARTRASALSRSAAAISRVVRTCSSASTSLTLAPIAAASAFASSTFFAASVTTFCERARAVDSSAARVCRRSSRSFSISVRRVWRSRAMRAVSRRFSDSACSSAVSATLRERAISISRCWAIIASSSSRAMVSLRLVASSWLWRTETSASASMAARSFLLTVMISARRRMPRALNALFSSSALKGVWSMRVSDTDSSISPFCARLSLRTAETSPA